MAALNCICVFVCGRESKTHKLHVQKYVLLWRRRGPLIYLFIQLGVHTQKLYKSCRLLLLGNFAWLKLKDAAAAVATKLNSTRECREEFAISSATDCEGNTAEKRKRDARRTALLFVALCLHAALLFLACGIWSDGAFLRRHLPACWFIALLHANTDACK